MRELTDTEIGYYYDKRQAGLVDDLPQEGQVYLRSKYLRDVRANPAALEEIGRYLDWERHEKDRAARHARIAAAVVAHLDRSSLPLADWPERIREAAEQFQRIVDLDNHIDDVDTARAGLSALAGIWMTPEECEALYVGSPVPLAP